jgi:hypothetical protein
MSRILPYAAFALCYIVLSLALSLCAELVQDQALHFAVSLTSAAVAALGAVLVAQRVGYVSASGLLTTGLVLAATLYTLIWGIYHWQAVQAGSAVPFWRVAQVSGWQFVLSLVVQILAPVAWRALVPRPNNSFKPKPLRGSA